MTNLKKVLYASLTLLAASGIAAGSDQAMLTVDFKGAGSMTGWGRTSTLEAVPQDEWLTLRGNGWDSKIFRSIDLQPGYYLLTATGKGEGLHIRLTENLGKADFFDMNLSRADWRTDWRPFTVDRLTKAFLVIHLAAPGKTEAMVKQIQITRAREPKEDNLPSTAELERQRPSPELVRGCTFPGGPEKSFSDLRAWNANVARAWINLKPVRYADGMAEYAPGWEDQLAKTESYLGNARKAGFKVVLTTGGGTFHEGQWDNPKLPATVASVWRGIAQRLLPYRDVIYGYDLYNEPLDWNQMPNPPRQWRDIAKAAIKAIREVDQETWIVYEAGPGGLCWGFANMKPLPDARIIYSGHFYNPHEFTHQGVMDIKNTDLAEVKAKLNVRYPGEVNGLLWNKAQIKKDLEPLRQFQLTYHVPVLIGEFSVIRWAPKEDAVQYLKDLIAICEDYQWSWIYHGFREWPGWSVEDGETFSRDCSDPVTTETERAKVVKAGLLRNRFHVSGDWRIEVNATAPSGETLKTSFVIERPDKVSIKDERCDTLSDFNAKDRRGRYILKGVRAQECPVKDAFDPASLKVADGPGTSSSAYLADRDYKADLEWGELWRLPGGKIAGKQAVFLSYDCYWQRLDTVAISADGTKLILKRGTPDVCQPRPPAIAPGETPLVNIYISGRLSKLSQDNLFPILEPAIAAELVAPDAGSAERLLPKTMKKLRAGGHLKILAWGDSVTAGGFLPDQSRWQNQFVVRLKARYPKADIELVTEAWGGHCSAQYLAEPPGSAHNYQEKVLAAKPDLVISEFVNDSWINTHEVNERYGKFLVDFKGIGAEWIVNTPHYIRPDCMGLSAQSNIDNDPREYTRALRSFAAKNPVALADTSLRYGRLWRQGIPYLTFMLNNVNHPDERGMKIYADALMNLFP